MYYKTLYRRGDYKRVLDTYSKASPVKEPYRSEFRKDFGRLVHSTAFRRLKGKTQLFPSIESDYFRNRLTHSIEVAQVGKSIANKLNYDYRDKYFKNSKIDTDLIETICLAHDIGHPPFGHNGEEALDKCMLKYGGFEGNAQTLRILARLGKREEEEIGAEISSDFPESRVGYNMTYRTLASVLKYDKKIPKTRTEERVNKGYYHSEADLVKDIKEHVVSDKEYKGFKTIECQIMDLADDIAYSTYDLEDAMKGGFVTPLDMVTADYKLVESIAESINEREIFSYNFTPKKVREEIIGIFTDNNELLDFSYVNFKKFNLLEIISKTYKISSRIASDGYSRSLFTSRLVGPFIRAIELKYNKDYPQLSEIFLNENTKRRVEVLKHFTFQVLIMSPKLKITSYRGHEIISEIFKALTDERAMKMDNKYPSLLPDDFKGVFENTRTKIGKMRVVSDFIAGMTDTYAIEFYGRLKSENPQTVFKPL